MKRILLSALVAVAGLAMIVPDADARRFGGGGSAGFKRSLPARSAPQTPPPKAPTNNQAATPGAQNAAAAAAAAPAARRSWMAPLAGLAAGLGLAALMSHLGLGAEFANFIMMALLILAAVVVVRLLMRRFAGAKASPMPPQGMQFAGASPHPSGAPASHGSGMGWTAAQPVSASAEAPALPSDFDTAGFERIAKLIFIRMQAANDAGNLDDLRRFTTPEMFAAARLDLQERSGAPQQTDVVKLDAEVLDVAQEPTQQIVSVRYHGLIREEKDGTAESFDEIWHLVRPTDGSREWAIAGIAQTNDA